ncbi:retrotransposon protein, putative, ty3-gypsy subclass [Tanacetum coccineum]|uniref:Retrotransposon protein, putative, ty3-gypsy subclass n=1 Tax=Tanacetum coccineum TaxID=301880 RepID=A0ABQ5GEB5_9ASTR
MRYHLRQFYRSLRTMRKYMQVFQGAKFWLSRVALLGHLVSSEGTTHGSGEDGFSRLALPLTKLMRKGEKFVWNDEREKSFEELKQRLVSAPILTLPSGSGGFPRFIVMLSKKGHGLLYSCSWESDCLIITTAKTFMSLKYIFTQRGIKYETETLRYVFHGQNVSGPVSKIEPNLISQIKAAQKTMGTSYVYQKILHFERGLHGTQRKHDAIWVVRGSLDQDSAISFFRKDFSISRLAEMFQQEIVRLHGTPSAIVSDRDPRFTSRFWKGLQNAWGTRLKFSTAFHPETDGQSERTIQTLEDMLRSCA